MPSDQKDRYIRYLIEQQEEKRPGAGAMKLAVEEFQSIHDSVAESLANLGRRWPVSSSPKEQAQSP